MRPGCPCGSGVPRDACDPAELSLCTWGDCAALYHRHNNRGKYCAEHAREARRASNRETAKKIRRRRRRERELATIAAAAQKRQGAAPSPEQTTLDVTL